MIPSTTRKCFFKVIDLVNYYHNIYYSCSYILQHCRSYILQHLNTLKSSKVEFKFTYIYHKVFHYINPIVLRNTLLYYPGLNKQLYIHKYDGYFQLGSIIIQEGKPIYLQIRKLNIPKYIYMVREKELLSIIESLKQFQTILWYQRLKIYTRVYINFNF